MPQPSHLDPSAYAADGGPVGVLLTHGYTGSAAETRPMGEYLAARNVTVRCPLLRGHGTTPEDLNRIRWKDWVAQAELALRDLQGRCATVFVGGFSSGTLLALWQGTQHPALPGLILMAPAVKFRSRLAPLTLGLRYLIKYDPTNTLNDGDLRDPAAIERVWCYDKTPLWGAAELYLLQRQVGRALSRIRQPILAFQGKHDALLAPEAAQTVYQRVASTDKTLVWLEDSGHNLLVDGERESVWAQSYAWMMERVPRSQS